LIGLIGFIELIAHSSKIEKNDRIYRIIMIFSTVSGRNRKNNNRLAANCNSECLNKRACFR